MGIIFKGYIIKKFFFIIIVVLLINGCSHKTLKSTFIEKSQKVHINYKTLMAICYHESHFNPYVINVNKSIFNIQKGSHFFNNSITANLYMDFVLDPLRLNYDIGICQINKIHLKRLKLDNEDLLDRDTNIEVAAKIYKYALKKCNNNIICALSIYNTGYKKSRIGKIYAYKILKIRKKLFNK